MGMTQDQFLPEYRGHKIIRAMKVVDVIAPLDAPNALDVRGMIEDKPFTYRLPVSWAKRVPDLRNAHLGYLVVYEDSFQSWSPAKAFEEGYKPLKDAVADALATSEFISAAHKAGVNAPVEAAPAVQGAELQQKLDEFLQWLQARGIVHTAFIGCNDEGTKGLMSVTPTTASAGSKTLGNRLGMLNQARMAEGQNPVARQ